MKHQIIEENSESVVVVPHSSLSPDVLTGIIEEFVLQEGTDYGGGSFEDAQSEMSLEQKVSQVRKQLLSGRAEIVFDPVSESCGIQPVNRK